MSEQPSTRGTPARARPAKDPRQALSEHAPWRPPAEIAPEDWGALQACWNGGAAPHQQKRAIEFVLRISHNDGAHFFPGEDGRRDTDFALGRAYVGQMVSTALKFKLKQGGEHG